MIDKFPLQITNSLPGDNHLIIITMEYDENELKQIVPTVKQTRIESGMQGVAHCPRENGFLVMAKESEADSLMAGMTEAMKFLNDPRVTKRKTLLRQVAGFFAGKAKQYFS